MVMLTQRYVPNLLVRSCGPDPAPYGMGMQTNDTGTPPLRAPVARYLANHGPVNLHFGVTHREGLIAQLEIAP